MNFIDTIEEQVLVGFTGKVNIQLRENSQHLGFVSLRDGEVIYAEYNEAKGLKAFYNIYINDKEFSEEQYIVEPEIIDSPIKNIPYPYSVLKNRLKNVYDKYIESKDQKPPDNIKLTINGSFLNSNDWVGSEEYDLLCTISDYNLIKDIYKNSNMLDYEITNALVSLRKRGALKVVGKKRVES